MTPYIALALRNNGIKAISIHELGLANQGFRDDPLMELAVSREETLLTLDDDFLGIHAQWQEDGRKPFGIFYGPTNKYQHPGAIGTILHFCMTMDELIDGGAGTLEDDIYNQVIYISEV